MVTTNGYTMSFAYDGLGRMSAGSFSNKLQTAYTYLAGASGGTTTTLVSGLKNTISGSTVAQNYQYQYDKLGNMTQVKDTVSNKTTDYAYDNQGQLLTAVSKSGSTVTRREVYTYDTYGNIRTASDRQSVKLLRRHSLHLDERAATAKPDQGKSDLFLRIRCQRSQNPEKQAGRNVY